MRPLDYLPYVLFDDEVPLPDMGTSFATDQYAMSGTWYVPFPVISDIRGGTPADFWSAPPLDEDDAKGAKVGARTGMKIPMHRQAVGRYGIDDIDYVRNDQPRNVMQDEEWP